LRLPDEISTTTEEKSAISRDGHAGSKSATLQQKKNILRSSFNLLA